MEILSLKLFLNKLKNFNYTQNIFHILGAKNKKCLRF
jgi:hypothetical protein